LYQRTIDFGGHPNERSVTGSMKMIEEPDKRVMVAVMLHGDDAALVTIMGQPARGLPSSAGSGLRPSMHGIIRL
jgi:hypothetical protein